ncbi:hypothetical protein L1049_011764 [Liquidambar formosana]|uniref:Uncharacterized protein n=1 Tax=Liquidambar formosana TaxID=63359 RepID=A0AAP0RRW6_LIQFO
MPAPCQQELELERQAAPAAHFISTGRSAGIRNRGGLERAHRPYGLSLIHSTSLGFNESFLHREKKLTDFRSYIVWMSSQTSSVFPLMMMMKNEVRKELPELGKYVLDSGEAPERAKRNMYGIYMSEEELLGFACGSTGVQSFPFYKSSDHHLLYLTRTLAEVSLQKIVKGTASCTI